MARRLTTEARRAEIVETAQAVIAAEGSRSLSMREFARRCGMSAPGLMHYFPDIPSLLEAVLDRRDEADLAAILEERGPDPTLLDVLDAARVYYADRETEARNFDALEAEALDPSHPAHGYFARRAERAFLQLRPYIEREFEQPEKVETVVRLLIDGARLSRLRSSAPGTAGELDAEWAAIREVIDRFPRRDR